MKENNEIKKNEKTLEAKVTDVIITIVFFIALGAFALVFAKVIPFYYLFPIILIPIFLLVAYYVIKYFIVCPPKKQNPSKKEILYDSKRVQEINKKINDKNNN